MAGSLVVAALAVPTSAAPVTRFEVTSCDLPDMADVASRVRCGIVRVPRDHAHPDGPTYALAVVVIASVQQPAQPDPVLYISGGPGGPLTIYTGFQARHPYAAGRNLILVDQRGMGRSEPRLCPEMQGGLVNAMLAVAMDPTSEALAADRAAHVACRDAIRARGIDLDTFGTAATADDYEWVRQALGIERWNVVGESYGTTVAMTLLARHPKVIRSAVLDSLNPPDAYFGMAWSERVALARDKFLALSRPDLSAVYLNAVERLRRQAPSVPLPPALQVPGNRVRLTPSLFEEVVGRLVYYPPFYPVCRTSSRRPATMTCPRLGQQSPLCSRGQRVPATKEPSSPSSVGTGRAGARVSQQGRTHSISPSFLPTFVRTGLQPVRSPRCPTARPCRPLSCRVNLTQTSGPNKAAG